jgi:hypothetical protein
MMLASLVISDDFSDGICPWRAVGWGWFQMARSLYPHGEQVGQHEQWSSPRRYSKPGPTVRLTTPGSGTMRSQPPATSGDERTPGGMR